MENEHGVEPKPKLGFTRLSDRGFPPQRGSAGAAGYDLRSSHDAVVPKHGQALIRTDIALKLPTGCYGRIAPRSGLALKHGIDVLAGVIDSDFTGNVGVLLFNHSDEDFTVERGDRVAQLICEMCKCPEVCEIDGVERSERGDRGFGSSGVR